MFKFFKKEKKTNITKPNNIEIELTASVLAYEVARLDGVIKKSELNLLLEEVKKITLKLNKPEEKILGLIEDYSKNSVSFYEFIEDINKNYGKQEKLSLIRFLWNVAFADNILEVDEERLIRRIADMIKIKDIEVLKLKDESRPR